jgi:heme oxygenase
LKTQTQPQHDEAEGHPLHAVLFGSRGASAARDAYAHLLAQHLLIQEHFELLLRRARWGAPAGPAVVRDHHFHLQRLRDDCAELGVTPQMLRPLPATKRFIDFIESAAQGTGTALLGVFYVFEGSTNGGTIIAMRVKELLGLERDSGTRFINPHGQQVRPRWAQWKQDVDALGLSEQECEEAVAGAREAFGLSHALLTDVHAALAGVADVKPQVVVLPIKAATKVGA